MQLGMEATACSRWFETAGRVGFRSVDRGPDGDPGQARQEAKNRSQRCANCCCVDVGRSLEHYRQETF